MRIPFARKKAEPVEVVTTVIVEAIVTTYDGQRRFLSAQSHRFALAEPDIPAALLHLVRQRVPKKEG